jgi:steroid delta-isomerase-like uncharacterized protein
VKMTPETARDMAENYTAAWCSHDPNAVASFYAEDGRIVINGGEPSVGREEIAAMAKAFYDEFPDLVVRMDDIRTSGTHAVYRWTLEGTHSGAGGTGNRVEVSGWEYWRYSDDGLVAESAGHFDAEDYQRQVEGR